MSDYRSKLQMKKEMVNVSAVGLQGGIYAGFTPIDVRSLEDSVIRYGVAQAILDNIAQSEDMLAVRDILPDKDLQDQNAVAITKREWRQPWSGSYNKEEAETQIYQTNINSKNTQKVFVVFGLRATNTGPGRTSSALNTSAVVWKRGTAGTKLIDIWQIEILDTIDQQVVYARTPLLFKRNDDMSIYAFPKTGASGSSDNLIILGKCIEALGATVTG